MDLAAGRVVAQAQAPAVARVPVQDQVRVQVVEAVQALDLVPGQVRALDLAAAPDQDRGPALVPEVDLEAVQVVVQVVEPAQERVPERAQEAVRAAGLAAGLAAALVLVRAVDRVQEVVREPEAAKGVEIATTRRPLYRATQALRTSHRYHQPF